MLSGWANSTFAALRHGHFRTLWIGTSLAFLAFMMSFVVQSVVAFDLTGKNAAVGFVGLGQGVATILVSPFGGVIADRVSKRKLLLIGQTTIGFSFAAVGLLIVTGQITIAFLVASTFLLGVVFSFIAPARQAWIGELLPPESMANGIALQQVAMTATRVVGPFLAGGLVGLSFFGTAGAYFFMSALFIIVVATLISLPPTGSTAKKNSSVRGDLMLGLNHLRERPKLGVLAVSFIGVVLAGYSWQVLLPGLLENELGHKPEEVGPLIGASAISGLIVTLWLASRSGSDAAYRMMHIGAGVLGGSLMLLAIVPNFATAVVVMFVLGAGSGSFQLLNNALVMREADPQYFGRVMSITMLAWGFNGLAGLPFGFMADSVGERQTLALMGALVFVVSTGVVLWLAALGRRKTPDVAVEATPAGGGR